MQSRGSSILVTGASGLIGWEIATTLVSQGYRVLGTYFRNKPTGTVAGLDLVQADLQNRAEAEELFCKTSFDAVVHCASQQPKTGLQFADYYNGNALLLDQMLTAMRPIYSASTKPLIIHLSTVSLYELPEEPKPITENSAINPTTLYALSKYSAEQLLRICCATDQFRAVCFRLPSMLLPRQPAGLAYCYYNAARNNQDLELYSEGRYHRNVLLIEDLIEACIATIEGDSTWQGFNLFLLGSRDSLTALELAQNIFGRVGSKGKIIPVKQDAPIRGHWLLDTRLAQERIGFRPHGSIEAIERYLNNVQCCTHEIPYQPGLLSSK